MPNRDCGVGLGIRSSFESGGRQTLGSIAELFESGRGPISLSPMTSRNPHSPSRSMSTIGTIPSNVKPPREEKPSLPRCRAGGFCLILIMHPKEKIHPAAQRIWKAQSPEGEF